MTSCPWAPRPSRGSRPRRPSPSPGSLRAFFRLGTWVAPLPDGADQLAADLLLAGLAVDEDALRRRQDRDAHAAQDPRDRVIRDVPAQPGLRDALDVADRGLAVAAVLQEDGDGALHAVLVDDVVLDEALVLQDFGEPDLEPRLRDEDLLVPGRGGVPDARQHVADGIGEAHWEVSYQLDLMTPTISPCSARLRKQSRHIWNFRRNARGRPHSGQRLYWRTGNFSLRFACAIFESFAIVLSSLLAERQAEVAQECSAFLVVPGGGHHRDVEPFDLLDLVVVDLREDDLLAHPERVVTLPVERLRRHALEVAHPRQRDGDEPVEELVHPGAAQGHHRADGLPLPQLEVRDGLARLRDHRLLAGDGAQLLDRGVDDLAVVDRLAEPHVHDDLLELRSLHRVLEPELLHHLGADLPLESVLQACCHLCLSLPSAGRRSCRAMRVNCYRAALRFSRRAFSFAPSSRPIFSRRTGAPSLPTTMTFESAIVPDFSTMPPSGFVWLRPFFTWRFTTMSFSTRTRVFPLACTISRTLPDLPFSLPEMTWTVSPLRMTAMARGPPGRG